ncbi:MAG: chemotaxis protein CheX [Lachnospiraceae bacterium]|nr:chemotaxis protein CheX [Lachnospiraceae bacterium]
MFDRMLGQYLVDAKLLTKEQLKRVYEVQEKARAKLGVIAVGEKLMSVAQAEEVNAAQALEDKRFGDIAVEKGYISKEQLERLVQMQGSAFHTFMQVIADEGFLKLDEIQRAMKDFQRENKLLPRDMDALVAGDLDRITQMHLPPLDAPAFDLFAYAVKNMYRLVDSHVAIGKAEQVKKVKSDVLACQAITGDVDATMMIFGEYEDLRSVAVTYTKEEFIETSEDVLDAMSELINTNNGMFARNYSQEGKGEVELTPPAFYTKGVDVSAKEIVVLPVNICDGTTNYAVALGQGVKIEER